MCEAVGISYTIGVAMGGAVIILDGVAGEFAHGIQRGPIIGSNTFQLGL